MFTAYRLLWFLIAFLLSFTALFCAFQKVEFKKIFKSNSTWQIKTIITLTSAAIAFCIAVGLDTIINILNDL